MKFNENLYQQLKSKRQELEKIKTKLNKLGFDRLVEETKNEIELLSNMITEILLAPIDEV